MKLLRHPIRAIREPFGKAGLIVAVVALVAALGGSAIAAKGALTGKQKKEVQKIAKKEAKKFAKSGKAGAPGAQGPAGAPGAPGAKGDTGAAGAAGGNGKSVTVTPVAIGSPGACEESGGAMVKEEGASSGTEVCNGLEGPQGPAGSPWTANGLPPGKSEMGTFATGEAKAEGYEYEPISFTVPLAEGKTVVAHLVTVTGKEESEGVETTATVCTGTHAEPTAPPGTLCLYENARSAAYTGTGTDRGVAFEYVSPVMSNGIRKADAAGGIAVFYAEPHSTARGVWVVTAPTS